MLAIPTFPFLFDFIEAKAALEKAPFKLAQAFPFLFDFIEAKAKGQQALLSALQDIVSIFIRLHRSQRNEVEIFEATPQEFPFLFDFIEAKVLNLSVAPCPTICFHFYSTS